MNSCGGKCKAFLSKEDIDFGPYFCFHYFSVGTSSISAKFIEFVEIQFYQGHTRINYLKNM